MVALLWAWTRVVDVNRILPISSRRPFCKYSRSSGALHGIGQRGVLSSPWVPQIFAGIGSSLARLCEPACIDVAIGLNECLGSKVLIITAVATQHYENAHLRVIHG